MPRLYDFLPAMRKACGHATRLYDLTWTMVRPYNHVTLTGSPFNHEARHYNLKRTMGNLLPATAKPYSHVTRIFSLTWTITRPYHLLPAMGRPCWTTQRGTVTLCSQHWGAVTTHSQYWGHKATRLGAWQQGHIAKQTASTYALVRTATRTRCHHLLPSTTRSYNHTHNGTVAQPAAIGFVLDDKIYGSVNRPHWTLSKT